MVGLGHVDLLNNFDPSNALAYPYYYQYHYRYEGPGRPTAEPLVGASGSESGGTCGRPSNGDRRRVRLVLAGRGSGTL